MLPTNSNTNHAMEVALALGDFTNPIFWDEPENNSDEPIETDLQKKIKKIFINLEKFISSNSTDASTLKGL